MTDGPTRPVLRWHGGKWRLAPWIMSHFPPHRIYVEPFGGAASVLLRKKRSYAEVYNDLDHHVVSFFRVLQDPERAPRLIELLRLTPFAREEFELGYVETDDPIESARRLVIRAFMGHGSDSMAGVISGFRANSNKSGTTPAHDWVNYVPALPLAIERMRGVVIEQRDGKEVMAQHDSVATLHYVDPPYMHETRSWMVSGKGKGNYRHELTDAKHLELLEFLRGLKGMIVLSGYPTALYEENLSDWRRVETAAHADGARPRVEVLWINPQACAALAEPVQLTFAGAHSEAAE
jgi:DNA adenine methylase